MNRRTTQTENTPEYPVDPFSLSLPSGDNQANIPDLLEHLSQTIREYGQINILDIVFQGDAYVDNEPSPQFTVYYIKKSD